MNDAPAEIRSAFDRLYGDRRRYLCHSGDRERADLMGVLPAAAPARIALLTGAKGASLADPAGLFNASLEGNTRCAIDFHENDEIDEAAFKILVRAAVVLNQAKAKA